MALYDGHVPYHNEVNVKRVTGYVQDAQPDTLVLGGDWLDCYLLMKFRRDPSRINTIQDEIDMAAEILRPMVAASGEIHYIMGNHEERLQKFLWENPGLYNCRSLALPSLFAEAGLPGMKFHDNFVQVGEVLYIHGERYGVHPAWNVMKNDFTRGITVQGHAHRPEMKAWTSYNNYAEVHVCGHLSDREQVDYQKFPSWRAGFIIAEQSKAGCNVVPVLIDKRGFNIGGQAYA
ncbi:MAG: metallophosphoesterase [Candidatus Thorarchaeota archaeon]